GDHIHSRVLRAGRLWLNLVSWISERSTAAASRCHTQRSYPGRAARDQHHILFRNSVSNKNLSTLRFPPPQVQVLRSVEQIRIDEPRVVLQLPFIVRSQVPRILARPEPGGIGHRIISKPRALCLGKQQLEADECPPP